MLAFDPPPPAALPSPRPVVVMSWRENGVESYWEEFNIACWVRDWATALELVLPPQNDHVQIRIRA